MNKQLEEQAKKILIQELKPGGLIYQLLEQHEKPTKNIPKIDPLEGLFSDVNAKLERVKELNDQKGRDNLLECAMLREKEAQQKYHTTLLGLVDLVDRFGGDSGAMMNWDAPEFIKNAKPEEVIENVYKVLKELEEDSRQRNIYSFANDLIRSAKNGRLTNRAIMAELKKYFPNANITLSDGLIIATNS